MAREQNNLAELKKKLDRAKSNASLADTEALIKANLAQAEELALQIREAGEDVYPSLLGFAFSLIRTHPSEEVCHFTDRILGHVNINNAAAYKQVSGITVIDSRGDKKTLLAHAIEERLKPDALRGEKTSNKYEFSIRFLLSRGADIDIKALQKSMKDTINSLHKAQRSEAKRVAESTLEIVKAHQKKYDDFEKFVHDKLEQAGEKLIRGADVTPEALAQEILEKARKSFHLPKMATDEKGHPILPAPLAQKLLDIIEKQVAETEERYTNRSTQLGTQIVDNIHNFFAKIVEVVCKEFKIEPKMEIRPVAKYLDNEHIKTQLDAIKNQLQGKIRPAAPNETPGTTSISTDRTNATGPRIP